MRCVSWWMSGAVLVLAGSGCVGFSSDGQDDGLSSADVAVASAVVNAAETLGAATAVASYARGVEVSAAARDIRQFGDCPVVDVELDAPHNSAAVTMDFGERRSPMLYSGAIIGGSIAGVVQISPLSIELTISELTIEDRTLSGRLALGLSFESGAATFNGELSISSDDGSSVTLDDVSWTIDIETGAIVISGSGLIVDAEGYNYQVTVVQLTVDAGQSGNFIPSSGSITGGSSMKDGASAVDGRTVEITFTTKTPQDGTVLVSVNGGPQIPYHTSLVD